MNEITKQENDIPITWGPRYRTSPIYTVVLSISLALSIVSCSNGSSKTPPTRPVQSSNTAGQEGAQPTKVTSRNASSRNEDDVSENKDKPSKPRKDPNSSDEARVDESTPKTPAARREPLDPVLARMTCQAPPIKGDARKLIAYLNNPNASGANQITQEERRRALNSVKDINVDDPASLKVLQDELDTACK
jgi:hypothetical protein